ncbi:hypothetical protein [Streptacidiphilus sp. P02-A3a]|uniref:hypothetical protein n=1 Tax=Streptacidiphilus sp. P02-A3a TaxID=2704468 RepID=UPI0015FA4826|nr:hypothetical protein [Streptacidiphilus sp. P02-A3a]QMU72711.1 hypothetical protein GXP74_35155 [Streptacidiphilus sp. P02-A3a]
MSKPMSKPMDKGPAGEGPDADQATAPLPRRGVDASGRIPTAYGPGNPVRDQLDAAHYRIRPGAPNLPIPEPQQADGSAEADAAAYPIRPGTPEEPAYERFQALAERKERLDRRRTRIRWGAALVALCCLVAVGVALLASSSPKKRQAAAPQPTLAPANPTPSPTAPPSTASSTPSDAPSASAPAANPVTLLSGAATDGAPLDAAGFFAGRTVTVDKQSYTRALTTGSACTPAVTAQLAAVLTRNGCRTLLRASYSAGTTAVTVGVAVFDSAAQAQAVKQQTTGNLQPLSGGGLPVFCRLVVCRMTTNAIGRYAYFTVAGYTTGKPVPANDTSAYAATTAMNQLVFDGLLARAQREAATPSAG